MKRTFLFAVIFVCCMLTVSAQDGIKVGFQGAAPDIMDFAWSWTSIWDDQENTPDESAAALRRSLECYRKGEAQPDGFTITVDKKAGYILVQSKHDGFTNKWEMCYWNMADKKHKLFALCVELSENGKRMNPGQFDGLLFYRYDNATKQMQYTDMGIEVKYFNISYALPRLGKDIIVTHWSENGREKWQTTLKWNGHGFSTPSEVDYSSGSTYNQDLPSPRVHAGGMARDSIQPMLMGQRQHQKCQRSWNHPRIGDIDSLVTDNHCLIDGMSPIMPPRTKPIGPDVD